VYELRDELMTAEDVTPLLDDVRADVVNAVADAYIPPQTPEEMWNLGRAGGDAGARFWLGTAGRLARPRSSDGMLRGKVVDPSGGPVQGARVAFGFDSVSTAADGLFAFRIDDRTR